MHIVYLIDMNVPNMKTSDAKEKKQLKQLSDEELEKVNGGARSTVMVETPVCNLSFEGCPAGEIYKSVDGKCQCVPMPNTDYRYR